MSVKVVWYRPLIALRALLSFHNTPSTGERLKGCITLHPLLRIGFFLFFVAIAWLHH